MNDEAPEFTPDSVVPLEITSELDLHTFQPRDVKNVVLDYIEECRARDILEVRIIHGKGIGEVKRTVESILKSHPVVERFAPASAALGGMGATIAWLKRKT